MPEFVYVGDEGRVYPSLPAPASGPRVGQTYKLPGDPGDGRWKPASKNAASKTQPADPATAGDTQE